MKKGRTIKPCPACKEPPDWQGRPTDGICGSCERKLKEYTEIQADFLKRQQAGMEAIRLPEAHRFHDFPGFYMGTGRRSLSGIRDRLREVIARLIFSCAEKEPTDGEKYPGWSMQNQKRNVLTHDDYSIYGSGRTDGRPWNSLDTPYLIKPETAELFRQLYDVISAALVETYDVAKEDGQNVLLQLASGDMSVNQFNKVSAGKRKDESE